MVVKLVRCGTGHVRLEGVTDPRGGHYTAHRYRNGGGHHGFRWAVENSRGSQVEDCETLNEVRELFGELPELPGVLS